MKYLLEISTKNRRISLIQGNKLIKSWPAGVGKHSTPTPKGTFKIISKVPNPGGVLGSMWLGLNIKDYGIHGTNNPQSIGNYVSKGCIRMYNHDVLELAKLISIGTTVIIK